MFSIFSPNPFSSSHLQVRLHVFIPTLRSFHLRPTPQFHSNNSRPVFADLDQPCSISGIGASRGTLWTPIGLPPSDLHNPSHATPRMAIIHFLSSLYLVPPRANCLSNNYFERDAKQDDGKYNSCQFVKKSLRQY